MSTICESVTCYTFVDSPCGRLLLTGDGEALTGLYLPDYKGGCEPQADWRAADGPFAQVRRQLAAYFAGELRQFDLPLRMAGTPFQQRVWSELTRIPFGQTISYAELARRIDQPTAVRAVGAANGRNPISIIVPCHRVIGADGRLTGYGGGLQCKAWLIGHEAAVSGRSCSLELRGALASSPRVL
jgi:methylated-DNA-[protein]-cysteine S-methyltransferase